jgi:hypothetical protein
MIKNVRLQFVASIAELCITVQVLSSGDFGEAIVTNIA